MRALIGGVIGAFALAAVTGIGLMIAGKATRKTHLPFGPFMLGAAVAMIALSRLLPSVPA